MVVWTLKSDLSVHNGQWHRSFLDLLYIDESRLINPLKTVAISRYFFTEKVIAFHILRQRYILFLLRLALVGPSPFLVRRCGSHSLSRHQPDPVHSATIFGRLLKTFFLSE